MQFTEHRSRAQGLADLLLYDSLIDDGVMLLQDGALMAAWTFRGPDMASATNGEMAALSARLNNILRLGSRWMLQCDAIGAPGNSGQTSRTLSHSVMTRSNRLRAKRVSDFVELPEMSTPRSAMTRTAFGCSGLGWLPALRASTVPAD